MKLDFKNRMAVYYLLVTAIITAIAFAVIYVVVHTTVYANLDADLLFEAEKHKDEIIIENDSIKVFNIVEWEEREHQEVQVNPVFIQFTDAQGNLMEKSPNLKSSSLQLQHEEASGELYNVTLETDPIRQIQIPVLKNGEKKGYIIAAMSLKSIQMLLNNLKNILIISFLVVLLILFFMSRYLAGKNIEPIQNISSTIQRITRNNLKERVVLPNNKDELFDLSLQFNELLQRIENTLEREKQFTSDASHELRTPLAAMRGTLEVLIRKERTTAEYKASIQNALADIDRMSESIEQLLLLARMDKSHNAGNHQSVALPAIIDDILGRYKDEIRNKALCISFQFNAEEEYPVPLYYTHLIVENIIKNAIKYTKDHKAITIQLQKKNNRIICNIQDEGIGIKAEDLDHLYHYFFRSDALKHKEIPGTGLGLSIVKKAAEAIKATLDVTSELGKGTIFTITFLSES